MNKTCPQDSVVDSKCHNKQCSCPGDCPTSQGGLPAPWTSQAKFLGTHLLHMPKKGKTSAQTQTCTKWHLTKVSFPITDVEWETLVSEAGLVLECRSRPSGPPSVPHPMLDLVLESKVPMPMRKSERKVIYDCAKKRTVSRLSQPPLILIESFEVVIPPKLNFFYFGKKNKYKVSLERSKRINRCELVTSPNCSML